MLPDDLRNSVFFGQSEVKSCKRPTLRSQEGTLPVDSGTCGGNMGTPLEAMSRDFHCSWHIVISTSVPEVIGATGNGILTLKRLRENVHNEPQYKTPTLFCVFGVVGVKDWHRYNI